MTAIIKPYYLFGGPGYDYLSAHFSQDEAEHAAAGLVAWKVYVYQDEGLLVVAQFPAPVVAKNKTEKVQ